MANHKKEKSERRTVRVTTLCTPKEIETVGGKEVMTEKLAEARDEAVKQLSYGK